MKEEIAAVLIVKNEEAVLGRCLRSLAGLDELVVMDTGSTDGTMDVARECGAAVFERPPQSPFHFAEARNEATAKARAPWVLSIDADEVLRPGALRKFRKAVDEEKDCTAFAVTFISQPEWKSDPGETRTVATRKTKLFRKDAWTWRHRIHEQLDPTRPGAIGYLSSVSIEHLPEPEKAVRHAQNRELLDLCLREEPDYVRLHRHLGLELMQESRWTDAIPHFETYVEKNDEGPLETSVGMIYVACCLVNQGGRREEALEWFERAHKADPRRREPLYGAGMYLSMIAQDVPTVERAMEYVNRALEIPPGSKPGSPHDWPAAWGDEPKRLLASCKTGIQQLRSRAKLP